MTTTETHECPTCMTPIRMTVDEGERATHNHPGSAREVTEVLDTCECPEVDETPMDREQWTEHLAWWVWSRYV